ncbi:MAG TPA: DnaA/Hda family protein, partial [Gemmataceae bacterium]|nr:DnaA/Hda family protein [Gemmataceae bacterium]
MTTREREVVGALERAIVRRIGEPRYGLWFHGHTRFAWEADLLTVGVPNLHLQEWLQKKFEPAVREAAAEAFGQPMRVRFAIDPELFRAARKEQAEAKGPAAEGATERSVPSAQYSVPGGEDARPGGNHSRKKDSSPGKSDSLAGQQDGLPGRPSTEPRPSAGGPRPSAPEPRKHKRRWRRLGEFVVGPCNRVAHASALSAVEAPGQGPNPLVLHGPVGTGKTHLLEGVYAGLRKARPDWRVCFVTAEDFTTRFVQAVRLGKLGAFRRHFRECDALLVDDLHFLAAKKATQEEFLHTFDALLSDGRQLVVTCDCHPKLSDDFLPELADRLL